MKQDVVLLFSLCRLWIETTCSPCCDFVVVYLLETTWILCLILPSLKKTNTACRLSAKFCRRCSLVYYILKVKCRLNLNYIATTFHRFMSLIPWCRLLQIQNIGPKEKAQNLWIPATLLLASPQPQKPHLHQSSSIHQLLSPSLSLSRTQQWRSISPAPSSKADPVLHSFPPRRYTRLIMPKFYSSSSSCFIFLTVSLILFPGFRSEELPAVGGDVQEEGHTSGVLRGREGVLQRRAGDDHRWDPEGVRRRRLVR